MWSPDRQKSITGNLRDMHILGAQLRPTESETLGVNICTCRLREKLELENLPLEAEGRERLKKESGHCSLVIYRVY